MLVYTVRQRLYAYGLSITNYAILGLNDIQVLKDEQGYIIAIGWAYFAGTCLSSHGTQAFLVREKN